MKCFLAKATKILAELSLLFIVSFLKMINVSRIKILFKLPDMLQTKPKCPDTLNYWFVLQTLGGRTQRWRMVAAHSPNGECFILSCEPCQTGQWGPALRGHPRFSIPSPQAQVGTPGGGLSGPAQFSPTMVVVGVCCSDSKSFKFWKTPRTGADNQEDPKSRTEGTKQLSSSPW